MNVGLTGRNLRGSLELGNSLRTPSQTIQGFTHKDVSSGRIRALLLQLAKFFERAGVVLRPQAALAAALRRSGMAGVGVGRGLQVFGREAKLVLAEVAHPGERPRLGVRGVL